MTSEQQTLKEKVDRTVVVDLDGVLAYYDGWKSLDHIGNPNPGARKFLEALWEGGYYIIIATARLSDAACTANNAEFDLIYKYIERWLAKHNMPYDEIWTGRGKPLAVAYVDDRAVPCTPQFTEGAFRVALPWIKDMCGTHWAGRSSSGNG